MTVPRWHKKLAAAGLVLGLVAIVAVALTMFSGGFTKSHAHHRDVHRVPAWSWNRMPR